ncbi:MAG: arginine--tRNA ligase [bacterium]|nr:arginine--tRNA ligase [bacterium]
MREKLTKLVQDTIREIWGQEAPELSIEIPENSFGDYASSVAFSLAKILKKTPVDVADEIVKSIEAQKLDFLSKVQVNVGYVNFFLARDYLTKELARINELGAEFGKSNEGQGKKVIIEYSQPNIAKPLHAGHLRNTILGEAIACIYDFLGYETVRWNYLGDWGTQFGKVIAAYKLWGEKEKIAADPVNELVNLYVKFNEEAKSNPDLDERGRQEFKKLEEGDKENRQLWQWFREESLKSLDKIYAALSIKFDSSIGESFYEGHLGPLIERFLKEGIAQVGEGGALVVELDDLPPALVRKSDGASLYLTRDIANLEYRLKEFHPAKILYVVDAAQGLHFEQLFAIAKILGIAGVELEHLKYGLVLGEDGKKLSTRAGNAIDIKEIIEKAVSLAQKVVEEKNPDLSAEEKQTIAQKVGLGALKYEMVKDNRNSSIVFSWEKMLDFSGNSAPYLQYSYARLMSIMEKAGAVAVDADYDQLTEEEEWAIIKHLINFPDVISESAHHYATNSLALYLFELANLVNKFYEKIRILIDENESRKAARLVLIKNAANILKSGMQLLGIEALERV